MNPVRQNNETRPLKTNASSSLHSFLLAMFSYTHLISISIYINACCVLREGNYAMARKGSDLVIPHKSFTIHTLPCICLFHFAFSIPFSILFSSFSHVSVVWQRWLIILRHTHLSYEPTSHNFRVSFQHVRHHMHTQRSQFNGKLRANFNRR